MYLADHREEIKAANPELKVTEITKIASEKWKELDEETKNLYNSKHEAAREEYLAQMEEYEANRVSYQNDSSESSDDGSRKKKKTVTSDMPMKFQDSCRFFRLKQTPFLP